MAKTLVQELADRLARLEGRIASAEKQPRLSNASIDDETVRLKEGERVKGLLGRQPDGSHGSRVVESPAQPTPSAPILGSGKAGVVMVRWDGDADGPVPLVHGHVEVVASGPSSAAEVVSTIRDREGGATSFVADEAGTWSVHLVMVGQDRVTRSEPSQVSTIEVTMPVDGEQINDRLDAGEERLSDAKDEWEQSKTDLQDGLDQINNETIPQVRTDAQKWADDAEAAAVQQAAQDAQAEYDRLQEIAEQALAGAPNVIYDPSFETDWYQRAWGGENDLSVTTNSPGAAEPTEGVQVLRASNDTGGTVAGELNFTPVSRKGDTPTNDVVDLSMNVRPGEVWRFEVDVRALAAGFDGTMRLRCMKAGSFQTVENLAFTPGQSWDTYTLDVTIPQGITSVYWRFQPTVEDGGFFADRVSVKNVTDFKQALDKAEAAAQAAQDAHEQAGEAKTQADTAMTRAGQVGARLGGETPPVGTAPENSLWFQWSDMDDPNRTATGVWQMIDGNWTEKPDPSEYMIDLATATVGVLKAVRIDVASLYADTQFVNKLHAETVEALKVTAETGFIGGVLLGDGAIDARHIAATESMHTKLVESINAKIVNLDTNSLVANTGFVADLEAHGITLSSEANNRRFEVSGEGWSLTNPTSGEVLASLGISGGLMLKSVDGTGRMSEMSGAGFRTEATDGTVIFDSRGSTGKSSTAFGVGAVASAGHTTAIGERSTASGDNSTAIGQYATASDNSASALGTWAEAEGNRSTALGAFAKAPFLGATALGDTANAMAERATALGATSGAEGTEATAVGTQAQAKASQSTAVGWASYATGDSSTAVGRRTSAGGDVSTALGMEANATNVGATALGYQSEALNNYGTAVGYQSSASGDVSTSLGPGSSASGYASVAIGRAAEVTADNTGVLGGSGSTQTNHWVVPGDFAVEGVAGGDGLIREIAAPVADSLGNAVASATAYIMMGKIAVVELFLSSADIPASGLQTTPLVKLHSDLGSASNQTAWSGLAGGSAGSVTGLIRSDGAVDIRWSGGTSTSYLGLTVTYPVA